MASVSTGALDALAILAGSVAGLVLLLYLLGPWR